MDGDFIWNERKIPSQSLYWCIELISIKHRLFRIDWTVAMQSLLHRSFSQKHWPTTHCLKKPIETRALELIDISMRQFFKFIQLYSGTLLK